MSNVPNPWNPTPSATSVATLNELTNLLLPVAPQNGSLIFVSDPSVFDFYQFAVSSNAAADGLTVLATSLGGTTRWVKTDIVSLPSIGNVTFGGGTDPATTFDGIATPTFANLVGSTYTLTRDIFLAGPSTVNAGITIATAGFRIFCNGLFTNNGDINANGKNAALGVAGGSSTLGSLGIGVAGGNGRAANTGVNGTNQSNGQSFATPTGGNGGAGGANGGGLGGTYTNNVAGNGGAHYLFSMLTGFLAGQASGGNQAQLYIIGGGAGGGGGGSDNGQVTGGGGGGGGGVLLLHAFNLVNNGTIRALGGNGASATGGGGNGGGGGGGGGGQILSLARFRSGSGSYSAAGGLGGNAVGAGGVAGSNGGNGEVHLFAA